MLEVLRCAPAWLVVTSLMLGACAEVDAPYGADAIDDGFVVPDGKEDDFLSDSAVEYVVEGRSFVTVEEGEGRERALELIELKHIAIAWFLNGYLIEREDASGELTGFGAMVKTGRYEDLEVEQLNGRSYGFTFRQLLAGRKDVLRRVAADGGRFSVVIGRPSNEELARLETNHEWYRDAPWDPWKPELVPERLKETLELSIQRLPRTPDSWWDFQRLIEDGVLAIDVHVGWDYHDALHLRSSWELYRWLIEEKGFDSPVRYFEQYDRRSGPLTNTIEANGREVKVEVRIFWGKAGTDTDPDTDAGGRVLEADLRESLRTRDVIVFEGHSGPFYGFPMANWRKTLEGDLDDSEMTTAEMPADAYQIVFAEGCDTFMVGPALMDNVHKRGRNIDVVTTTSMSSSLTSPVQSFLHRLLEMDTVGRHRPRAILATLYELDPVAMYGVHGVDDNPRLHPYADVESFCSACSSHSECGGAGNACIYFGDESGRRCTAPCTEDAAYPSGYRCRAVASERSGTVFDRMCVPRSLVCE